MCGGVKKISLGIRVEGDPPEQVSPTLTGSKFFLPAIFTMEKIASKKTPDAVSSFPAQRKVGHRNKRYLIVKNVQGMVGFMAVRRIRTRTHAWDSMCSKASIRVMILPVVWCLLMGLIVCYTPSAASDHSGVRTSNSTPDPKPAWSCPNWDPCLNASWAPTKPSPDNRINFTVQVLTADDILQAAILYYKYKIPYQNWQPDIDWFSIRMINDTSSNNKAAWWDMHNWKGGTKLQVWFEAYDPQSNRLKSPVYTIEVSGNDTWVPECEVPFGFTDCIETHFGFINEGWPQEVEDGGKVPSYAKIFVDIISIRGLDPLKPTSIRSAVVKFWYTDKNGEKIQGPFSVFMDPMDDKRTNMSTEQLYTSDPDQFLYFNISAADMYDRILISPDFKLEVSGEDFSKPNVPIWMNVVVIFKDDVHGTVKPLQGIEVTFSNSSGASVRNITDAQGKASYFTYQQGRDTWTMSAVYKHVRKEVRDILPNATRIRKSNFTYYIYFVQKDIPAPFQEDVDENYFLYAGIGIAGMILICAPISARHFMEKKRREEIKRMEKEARFKI